jgi:hypothetical protein
MTRSTTRELERRLWERPRRRGGERDDLTLSSLSSAFGFSEGDFDDMATAGTSFLMPIDRIPATGWNTRTHTDTKVDTMELMLQSGNVSVLIAMSIKRDYMHLYMVIDPCIIVIDSCHSNYLGHAAITGLSLMALAACYLLSLGAQDLFKHACYIYIANHRCSYFFIYDAA